MCGVFGFVSYDGEGPSLKRLEHVASKTMSRGAHAFGFAWIDRLGRMRMYKRQGRIADHIDALGMAADARMLIGHCRWATHGTPAANINNHPHPADGGWIVHNGVIGAYEWLLSSMDAVPVTECDSEILGLLIERGKGTLLDRCRHAAEAACDGPLVLCGLWNRPNRLIAVRAGNPLFLGRCAGPRYYFGSLADGLPGDVSEVEDDTAMEFTVRRLNRRRVPLGVR